MNKICQWRLLALLLWLPVGGCAQSNDATGTAEHLSASSPYGEAIIITNIPYATNATPRQNFDLILPAHRDKELFPLVVWIHGGAWLSGLKEWNNVKYLVRNGYAIANVDYRASTEAPFPAQIQDCNAALNFILARATNYGISPHRFVVGGGSAGGHLALLLGLARHEKSFGADPAIKPLAILDFFGPADFSRARNDLQAIQAGQGVALFDEVMPKLMGAPLEQSADKLKLASPIQYVAADNPPVLILHGGKDEFVAAAQSQRLHEFLDRAGVQNRLILIADAGHDGTPFSTPEIAAQVNGFLDRIFKDSSSPP